MAISNYQFQSPLYFILSQVVILKPNSLEIWTEFNMHQSCNLVHSTEIVTIVITITKPTFSRLYCSPTGNLSLHNIIYLLSIVKACGKHCDTSANNFISFQILFRKCIKKNVCLVELTSHWISSAHEALSKSKCPLPNNQTRWHTVSSLLQCWMEKSPVPTHS